MTAVKVIVVLVVAKLDVAAAVLHKFLQSIGAMNCSCSDRICSSGMMVAGS